MDRKKLGEFGVAIAGLIVMGIVVFSCAGGWSWLFGSKPASKTVDDPLGALSKYRACADGTVYMITDDGKVFWLVAGKATAVECPESISAGYGSHGDIKGGLYLQGKDHLWYFYNGAAVQVKEVPRADISEEEHHVTTMSANWFMHQSYGQQGAYRAGLEAGRDARDADSGSEE
jgi:hypothetical protein